MRETRADYRRGLQLRGFRCRADSVSAAGKMPRRAASVSAGAAAKSKRINEISRDSAKPAPTIGGGFSVSVAPCNHGAAAAFAAAAGAAMLQQSGGIYKGYPL